MFCLHAFLRAVKDGSDEQFANMAGASVLAGRAGKVVVRAGEPADDVYVLVSGCARTFVGNPTSWRTTGIVKGPAVFGDRDVLHGAGRITESMQLLTGARIMGIQREDFIAQWESNQMLRDWLVRDLASRFASSVTWFDIETGPRAARAASFARAAEQAGITLREVTNLVSIGHSKDEEPSQPFDDDDDDGASGIKTLVHTLIDEF